MTNKEILQAHLLDILFDGRNKEYGAYAIRRGYNHRMLMALGIGLSVFLLLFLLDTCQTGAKTNAADISKGDLNLTAVQLLPDKLPELPKPKPSSSKPAEPVKTIRNTPPLIVPDDVIEHTEAPDVSTINDNVSSTVTSDGKPGGVPADKPTGAGTGTTQTIVTEVPEPAPSFPPEFPGGLDALHRFLSKNLATPDNLETGEKKIVKARFTVDKDGSVSSVEIELSGGSFFDKEVIRVCKKMPKWKPAVQNGHPITVSYVLPVTFIGVEQ